MKVVTTGHREGMLLTVLRPLPLSSSLTIRVFNLFTRLCLSEDLVSYSFA
jgi:hypothetical protein